MDDNAFLEQLTAIGALKRGHFLLSSGRHADLYVEKFDLLRRPGETEVACRELIRKLGDLTEVELVVGPTTGGILLAFEVARQLGLPAAYAERKSDASAEREFRRGTVVTPGTRVLVVDDILTTGGSVRQTLAAVEAVGAIPVAVGMLLDRTAGTVDFGVPLVALASLTIASYDADDCPMCAAGVELVKPGTTPTAAM